MRERIIEGYLAEQVKEKLGGIAYKFTSPGRRAVPDRICVVKNGVFFVECKATDGVLSPAQNRELEMLTDKYNQFTYVVYSKRDVDLIIKLWEKKDGHK